MNFFSKSLIVSRCAEGSSAPLFSFLSRIHLELRLFAIAYCLTFSITSGVGQSMDSIAFAKARIQSGKYELNRFGISKIRIKTRGPSAITDNGISEGEKFTLGALTLFTGWSTKSSSQSMWMLNNEVTIQGINKNLRFPVYIAGIYEKHRDRVENDDGSSSIETVETYDLFWDDEVIGDIMENDQKIGEFTVKNRSHENAMISFWKQSAYYKPVWLDKKVDAFEYYDKPGDFMVNVTWQDQEYLLIYHSDHYQCALVHEDSMIALWQDAPSNVLSKKNRINPYLLIKKELTEGEAQQAISLLSLGLTLA